MQSQDVDEDFLPFKLTPKTTALLVFGVCLLFVVLVKVVMFPSPMTTATGRGNQSSFCPIGNGPVGLKPGGFPPERPVEPQGGVWKDFWRSQWHLESRSKEFEAKVRQFMSILTTVTTRARDVYDRMAVLLGGTCWSSQRSLRAAWCPGVSAGFPKAAEELGREQIA